MEPIPPMIETLLAATGTWLLTYLLHSSLLLGAAWLLVRRLQSRPGLCETLWKVAAVGAIATASLQLGGAAVRQPDGHSMAAAGAAGSVVSADASREGAGVPAATPSTSREAARPGVRPSPTIRATRVELEGERWLWGIVVVLWAGGALVGLGRLAMAHRRLRRLLRRHVELGDPRTTANLDELRRRMRYRRAVRVLAVPELRSPAAVGRSCIAVPPDHWAQLSPARQRVLLAHELAHLVRKDLAWVAILEVVCALLFFQPLNRVARRQIRDCAELLCDDAAVTSTGARRPLAESLMELAAWVQGDTSHRTVAAFAATESLLVRRVSRILGHRAVAWPRERLLKVTICLGLLVATTLLGPSAAAGVTAAPGPRNAAGIPQSPPAAPAHSGNARPPSAGMRAAILAAPAREGPTRGADPAGGHHVPARAADTLPPSRPLNAESWNTFLVHTHTDSAGGSRVTRLGAMGVHEWRRYDPLGDVASPVHLVVAEWEDDRLIRRIELWPRGDGTVTVHYTVQGRVVPLDRAGRRWLADRLIAFRG